MLLRRRTTFTHTLFHHLLSPRMIITLYPVYTIEQTSSRHRASIEQLYMLAGRASSSSQLHRVNGVLVSRVNYCTAHNLPPHKRDDR